MAFDPYLFSVGSDDPLLQREGIRNNNPGNMKGEYFGATGNDGRFAEYPDAETGIAAMAKQLSRYYTGATTGKPLRNVQDIISTWAPGNENNTSAYIKDVSQRLGVSPTDDLDLRDPAMMTSLASAIIHHENGGNPYKPTFVSDTVAKAVPNFTGAGMDTSYTSEPLDPDFQYFPDQGDGRGAFYYNAKTGSVVPASTASRPGDDPRAQDSDGSPVINPSQYPAMGNSRYGSGFALNGPQDAPQAPTDQAPNMYGGLPTGDISKDPVYGDLYNKSFWSGLFGNKGMVGGALKNQADVMNERIQNATAIQRYGMMFGSQQERNAGMFMRAGMAAGDAFAAAGFKLTPEQQHQMNSQSQLGKPLPASQQKMEQVGLQGIEDQRAFQNQTARYGDALKRGEDNGGFNLDKMSLLRYKMDNSGLPFTSPTSASRQYQQFQAFLENARQTVQNAQKGSTSDKRSEDAMAALTGGGGLGTNEQGITHLNFLGNRSALAEKGLRARINMGRTSQRQSPFPWDEYDTALTPSPFTGTSPENNAQGLIEDQPRSAPAAAAPVGNKTGVGMQPGETRSYGGIQVRRIQ